ncbi:MAG: hypothetical protein K2X82_11475, partial [Gemmataceae bacterium]|nr:hypothetical protein [Gemmataceae bacterium]
MRLVGWCWCWCWWFGVGLVVVVIDNNKIIVQLGNPTSGDAEVTHRAANPVQGVVAADEFMEFDGVLLSTG